jgi:hypothetical protein
MKRVIDGKLYNTETAQVAASDHYWDGSNWERYGRNVFLYKTAKGNFFLHRTTRWQGERDSIEALSEGEARQHYEELPEHELSYEETFGEAPEEA